MGNPFISAAKKTATSTKEKGNTLVVPDDLNSILEKYIIAKDTITSMEGVKASTGEMLLSYGLTQFKLLAKQQQKKPETITLTGSCGSVKIIVQDKFKVLSDDEVTDDIKDYIEHKKTYKFNSEILEKHMDIIAKALSNVLPPDDLNNLLILEEKICAKSGSLEKAIATGEIDIIEKLKPVCYVK